MRFNILLLFGFFFSLASFSYGQFCDEAQPGAGFPSDINCQNAVCAADPFCCNNQWDAICASLAASLANCSGCLTPSGVSPCPTCASPCGDALGYPTAPSIATVVADCDTDELSPPLAPGTTHTFCNSFTATNTTVNFNVVITSNCGGGNVTNFSWQLFNQTCGTPIQSGNLSNLTFSSLVVGQNYVFCYSFTVPNNCSHTQHCPYFIGAIVDPCPTADISYSTPICGSETTAQNVNLTGTGSFTGGTYSATPAGLAIDPNTGAILPSGSTPNTYTVSYTIPATATCPEIIATTSVTISAPIVPTFNPVGPFCEGATIPALPTNSTNVPSINGSWTPAINNTSTTTYTFIPSPGQCATTTNLTIEILPQPPAPTVACYETANFNTTTCEWEVTGTQPPPPTTACYETANFNTGTCAWEVTGTQPPPPATACYETASFNNTTCSWEVTGTQPPPPTTACYETANFNTGTCVWEVTGTQPPPPTTACYETASFNNTTCSWEVTGTQPPPPTTACYETANFNTGTCAWEVTGTQPPPPTTACYETANFNTGTCAWEVTGTQPPPPTTACYETASFNNTTCSWEVTGTQPPTPTTACYETANFNTGTCVWEVTGTQPPPPATACYETANFNNATCSWEVTGAQPPQPTTACYETANFNTGTCVWEVTGTQPPPPATACYETASFNNTTCSWEVTGAQPPQPTTACYETANFNTGTCAWEVTGTQPPPPTTACYETASFNNTTCSWEVTGAQPPPPTTACYETANFNTGTCVWEVTGTQPPPPTTACYETASFNNTTCSWEVTGTQPPPPTTACYETANFNTGTCVWEVTGTQPPPPTTACYETANFNTGTCAWEVTGTQPPPPATACYETANFNTGTCAWEVTGTQPPPPTTACYETANFNTGTCVWEVTGTQPPPPTTACYETANFNNTTCSWEVTGVQPPPPTTACYETANFNTGTCAWEVTGTQPPIPTLNCYEDATFNTTSCSWDVFSLPLPSYTIMGTDPSACGISDGEILISGLIPGETYTVSYNGGTSQSFTANAAGEIIISGLAQGVYTNFEITENGCTITENVVINLTEPNAPVVDAGAPQTVCEGDQLNLTAINPDGANISWDQGVQDGVGFTPPVGTTTYTVTAELNNCVSTDQVTITVNPNPTIEAGAPQTVCEGDQITLTATNPDGSNISWDQGVQDGVSFTPPLGTTAYTVTAELLGCTSTDEVLVTVNPNPTFTVSGANPTECGVADGVITISGLSPGGTFTVTYNGGVAQTYTANANGEVTITGLTQGTYTDFSVTQNGCTTTETVIITLVDPNPPTVDAGAPQTVCEGDQLNLTAINPDGANIAWDQGVQDGVGFTPPVGTTTYTVTAELNNCVSTDQVTITVNPNPTIEAGAPQTVCEGDQITLTATNPDGANISWDQGVQDGVSFTPPLGTTTYTVTAELLGCTSTDEVLVTVNPNPTFTVSGANPTECGVADGVITISGLSPGGTFTLTYNGGAAQTYTANTNGEVTITGLSQGTYTDFSVTQNGCTTTETVVITLVDPNPPTVDAGAPQTVCEGDQLNLTAINPDGANISWDQGVQDGVGFTPPVGTTTYTVTAELNNCVSTDQVTITVNPNPTIEAGAPQTVCEGDQITLTATNPDGANISWDQGVQDGVSFTPPLGTTTYTVTAELLGCTSTDEVLVTVNPNPTFTVSGANPTECGVADGVITISGLSPGGTFTVTYNGGAAQTYTANANGEVTITGLSQGTYTDFSVTQNGCTVTDNVVINLSEPSAPVVSAGIPQSVCIGDQVTLIANNPDGANITWNQGVTNGVPFTPALGTTTYTVTAELNNCVSTDQVTVTVHALPNVNAGPDMVICLGDEVTLNASGTDTYFWGPTIVNGMPFAPQGSGSFVVVGTDQSTGCQNTDTLFIQVNPTIPVFFDVDNNVGCVPTEITFFNQSPGNPVMCEWQIGGATVNSCSDFVFNFNNSGCHNVTLTLTTVDGCVSSHTETNFVCIDNDPIADFIVDPIEISTIDPTANFVNESVGATNYLWDFGDMMGSSTEEHPSYTYNPDSPGTYNVQLIAISENGCRDTTVKAIRIREAVIFYVPNAFTPDNNGVNEVFQPVFTSGFDPYNYHLTIFNRWGEIIFESFNAAVGWNGTYGGEVVKDGVYIWKIEFRELETDRRILRHGHVNVLR